MANHPIHNRQTVISIDPMKRSTKGAGVRAVFYMLLGSAATLGALRVNALSEGALKSSGQICGIGSLAARDRPFMRQLNQAMMAMDQGMIGAATTGEVDHDFATMMLPHHQGAIEMVKAELTYGSDPVLRRLGQEIIVDQQSEIEVMNLWLKKSGQAGAEK